MSSAPLSPAVRWIFRFFLGAYRRLALGLVSLQRHLGLHLGFGNLPPQQRKQHWTPSDKKVITGQSWDEFCDTLKAAGASLVAPGAPIDPMTQAEGYRYLSRLARAGLEAYVECSDVFCPKLCAIANGNRNARVCIGSDNPDNLYENAIIDSRYRYVVKGHRGTVPYLGFGTQKGRYGGKGGLQTVDYLEACELVYESATDQAFEIILSRDRPQGATNWLKLDPEIPQAMFIVRQTFGIRSQEIPATLRIDLLREENLPKEHPDVLTCQHLDDGLQSASILVAGASAMFAKWAYDFQSHTNRLPLFDPERSRRAGGDPNIRYYHSYWNLGPDEVLKVTFRPPVCQCWNFQLNNHWMESLDYRYHTVHTNGSLARPDPNGSSYTILVSHQNPNDDQAFRGNWIETVGHRCGTMCFRYVAPRVDSDAELPHPATAVISYASLVDGTTSSQRQ